MLPTESHALTSLRRLNHKGIIVQPQTFATIVSGMPERRREVRPAGSVAVGFIKMDQWQVAKVDWIRRSAEMHQHVWCGDRPKDLGGDHRCLMPGPNPVAPSHELAEALPNGEVAILPGGTHSVFRERPAIFHATVADFIARAMAE